MIFAFLPARNVYYEVLGAQHSTEASNVTQTEHCSGKPADEMLDAAKGVQRENVSEHMPAEENKVLSKEEKQRREEAEAEEALRAFRAKQVRFGCLLDLSPLPVALFHTARSLHA